MWVWVCGWVVVGCMVDRWVAKGGWVQRQRQKERKMEGQGTSTNIYCNVQCAMCNAAVGVQE